MSSEVTNAFASSSSSRIRSESEWPVIASARRPVTRSRIDVRSSSSRTSGGWRSSTSAIRYPATLRSLPEKSRTNRSGSGCPASEIAARRRPAAQPSVRSRSSATASSLSSISLARSNSAASWAEKRSSASRISVRSPARRKRCTFSCGSERLVSTIRRPAGRRMMNSSSHPSASGDCSSCRSSITSTSGSSSKRRSSSSRSTTASPRNPGVGPSGSTEPPRAAASALVTASQKCCASRSRCSTATHAVCSEAPLSSSHERTSIVLPLPAGAQTRTTPSFRARDSCSNSASRRTSRPWLDDPRTRASGTLPRSPLRSIASQYLRRAPSAQRSAEMGARRTHRLGPPRR